MRYVVSFFLCCAVVSIFFRGVESFAGDSWLLVGFIPALFVGFCVYAGVDKIVDDYF